MLLTPFLKLLGFGLLYIVAILLLLPFSVSWGASRSVCQQLFHFFYTVPLDMDARTNTLTLGLIYLFVNGLFWGMVIGAMGKLINYIR